MDTFTVILFHDADFNSCAKYEVFFTRGSAFVYLSLKLSHDEYESAMVLQDNKLVARYSVIGLEE